MVCGLQGEEGEPGQRAEANDQRYTHAATVAEVGVQASGRPEFAALKSAG